jgi:TonB family protein
MPASAETWSDWHYVRTVDSATNAVSANAQVVIKAKSDTDLYTLGVTCAAGRVAVSLQSTARHFRPGKAEATWKTDIGKQHVKDPWQVLAESDQVVYAQSPQALLAELTKGRKLFFGVRDAASQSINLVFPMLGARQAVGAAFAVCSGKGPESEQIPVEQDAMYLLLRGAGPKYPGHERLDGATATVSYTVMEDGKVADVKVLTESPSGHGFGAAAVASVEKWRYQPQVKDGNPVKRTGVQMSFVFKPDSAK